MIANQQQKPAQKSGRTAPPRSAYPTIVDTKGAKQRSRQYKNSEKNQIKQIRAQNPNTVRHRAYTQPSAKKSGRSASNITLFFVIFICFSLSLLVVYGYASLKNSGDLAAAGPFDTSADSSTQTDLTVPPDTEASADTQPDTPVTKPKPNAVYASATADTVRLGSNVSSSNAILIDLETYTIVAQKNSGSRIYPASMTKIMTLLVAVEHMESLDQKATVTREITDYCYRQGATVAYFKADETVTIEDLLYGTILPSGADATMTLAQCIAGSESAFAELMNQKAKELGLTSTHFVNSSGLHDPNHYSTVHDIAVILKAAAANDICYKVLTTSHYVTSKTPQNPEGLNLYSIVHSRISGAKVDGLTIVGGKTGYTPEAGQCLATYAISDDNREFILVTANAGDKKQPIADAKYVYSNYTAKKEDSPDIAA